MIEERLYSTGNDELDYILEKAFSDGYEYALLEQREYAGKIAKLMYAKNKLTNSLRRASKRESNFALGREAVTSEQKFNKYKNMVKDRPLKFAAKVGKNLLSDPVALGLEVVPIPFVSTTPIVAGLVASGKTRIKPIARAIEKSKLYQRAINSERNWANGFKKPKLSTPTELQ